MGEDTIIVPTILTDDTNVFVEQMKAYISFAKRIQIDLMDGTFTADKSLPESAIAGLPQDIDFDLHLTCILWLSGRATIYQRSCVFIRTWRFFTPRPRRISCPSLIS